MGAGDHVNDKASLSMRISFVSLLTNLKHFSIYFSSKSLEETKNVWRAADAVCFDIDSTVCMDEGIDELAKYVGTAEEVAALTQQAMRGGIAFEDALRLRLRAIRPSMKLINSFVASHPPRLTPHVSDLVCALHKRDVPVYLISGGFCCINEPVAKILEIPAQNVYCNRLKFYYNGDYAGFDESAPTARSGGKGEVVQFLKDKYEYKKVIIIGDGVTDMEASPPADAFIGFGGNQIRDHVKTGAKWFVTDFRDLINELQKT
uniref:Phosphoserine phosphatase n=1 Tax=Strigamia maritima TaxID=126957 RepID=T1IHP1_STRMM